MVASGSKCLDPIWLNYQAKFSNCGDRWPIIKPYFILFTQLPWCFLYILVFYDSCSKILATYIYIWIFILYIDQYDLWSLYIICWSPCLQRLLVTLQGTLYIAGGGQATLACLAGRVHRRNMGSSLRLSRLSQKTSEFDGFSGCFSLLKSVESHFWRSKFE